MSFTPSSPRVAPVVLAGPGRSTLYRRLFATYLAILTIALAGLVFAPVTVSIPVTVSELVILLLGFLSMLGVFHVSLQRTLAPLERLTQTMERVDPLSPGRRIDVHGGATEVTALAEAFNEMLGRLERERRDSARRALNAQEEERRRIARELHDEVGQVLTGIVLRSETLLRRAPGELQTALGELREAARHGAEDVRGIATRLRPEALDELGLQSALLALCTSVSTQSGITITRALERDLGLSAEQELVFYRVAQESITNVVRHAQASRATVTLRREADGDVVLTVRDDGQGIGPSIPTDASGLRGMRERALLVGAELRISAVQPHGTEVQLRLRSGGQA